MKKQLFIIGMMLSLLSTPTVQAQSTDCCCQSCTCPPGIQGPLGAQGVQGPQGLQGFVGLQGAVGPQGGAGIQGLPGDTGPCCPLSGTFANVYSNLDQTALATGDAALMENRNMSTLSIDTTMTGITGGVTVNLAGIYEVSWSAAGQLSSPYPTPVTCWSMALTLDDVIVPGSSDAAFQASPTAVISHTGGKVIISIAAGQTLKIVNTTPSNIDLSANPLGTVAPIASVSMNVSMLAAM